MKIYIACHSQEIAAEAARVLSSHGHTVTSSWLDKEFRRSADHSEEELQEIARRDMHDVLASETVILISGDERYAGGKFVEAGIALGAGIRLVVVGRRENALLYHPNILRFNDIHDAIDFLK